jgi:hypothetical protein
MHGLAMSAAEAKGGGDRQQRRMAHGATGPEDEAFSHVKPARRA